MDAQYRGHLAVTRDQISSCRKRERRLLHDEAVLLQPPVFAIESPVGWSDATDLDQTLIAGQRHTSRTGIHTPQSPRLCIVPGLRRRGAQGCDVLWGNRRETLLVYTSSVNRRREGDDCRYYCYAMEYVAHETTFPHEVQGNEYSAGRTIGHAVSRDVHRDSGARRYRAAPAVVGDHRCRPAGRHRDRQRRRP